MGRGPRGRSRIEGVSLDALERGYIHGKLSRAKDSFIREGGESLVDLCGRTAGVFIICWLQLSS